ncbi:lipopolysaccharide biosynthesis protein [Clostridium saudiense]|uniref:lipopolysaccharide biosynthesis protein n=1 Tax=Clostridium saudiense TaxID=1414720 RepID=UPI0018A8D062|nr:oligosaccharide flippase family protein [Clostridium saudiense]
MRIKSLLKGNTLLNSAIWYTVGTFLLKGINFFTTPIFTNLLSTEEFGIITIYSTWSAIFAIIVGLSMNGTIGSAKANLDDKEYNEYLSSTLFLGTISFAIICIVSLLFKNELANIFGLKSSLILILLFESFFAFVINYVIAVFTFDRNHKAFLFTSAISTIINVSASVLLILSMNNERYLGRIYGGAIATIVIGVILYIKIILKGRTFINIKYWRFALPIAIPLILHNLSHLVLNQADKIMLQKYTNDDIVGIYSYTYTIGALINTIQIALNSAWMPWYFEKLKEKNSEEIKKVSAIYIGIFTVLTSMFILGTPEIVKILSPESYWSGIGLLPIIIAGYYFVFLYTFPSNFQFYMKKTNFIAMGTIVSAIINIIINYIFIKKIGMYAAALSTLIAYIVLFAMHFIIVKFKFRHADFPFLYNLLGVFVIIIISCIFYIFLNNMFVRWGVIFLIICVCAYLGLKYLKRNSIDKN